MALDLAKGLRPMFADDDRFPSSTPFAVRGAVVRDDGLVIRLNSGNHQGYPETVVGADMNIVSARVLTAHELSTLLPAPMR